LVGDEGRRHPGRPTLYYEVFPARIKRGMRSMDAFTGKRGERRCAGLTGGGVLV
jgi:hypothetical protein